MTSSWSSLQIWAAVGGALALFLVQGMLSVALVAVSSLSRVALHRMSNGSSPGLAFLEGMREPNSTHRVATALMRQLCLLGGVALVALAARGAAWPYPGVAALGFAVILGVVLLETFAARILVLWDPRWALRFSAPLILTTHALLYPFVRPFRTLLEKLATSQPVAEERDDEQDEDVEAFIEVGERDGIFEANEGAMVRSIFDLDETLVREIMTPRTDIVALSEETTVAEAGRAIIEAGHSRLPVYRESIDDVIGVVHARDLLRAFDEDRAAKISGCIRPVIFVPETLSVADLLAEMRLRKHIGLVVDEYGGVSGLVTLEDLLEEIVGEIRDEHDTEEALVRQDTDGSWVINAAAHVEELEDRFGVQFEERDFDTVGGLVITGFGRVPSAGEVLRIQGLQIEVLEADRRRIRLVRIRQRGSSDEAQVGA